MSCVICKENVQGDRVVEEEKLPDGTWYLSIVPTFDCDWICCDACNAEVHFSCCSYPKSGYCDACVKRYKLYDLVREFGYEAKT